MELADAIIINKADGDNKAKAIAAKEEYNRILHFLRPATEGWKTKAYTASALFGEGISEIWEVIQQFQQKTMESGIFSKRRQQQARHWIHEMIRDYLETSFYQNPEIKNLLPYQEQLVMNEEKTVTQAVNELIQIYENKK
jgi:LAO/AO transport system kinase